VVLQCFFIIALLDILQYLDDDTGVAIAVEVDFLVVGDLSDLTVDLVCQYGSSRYAIPCLESVCSIGRLYILGVGLMTMQKEGAGCGGAQDKRRTYDASAKLEGRSRVIAPP
jgi:hypothetical protein